MSIVDEVELEAVPIGDSEESVAMIASMLDVQSYSPFIMKSASHLNKTTYSWTLAAASTSHHKVSHPDTNLCMIPRRRQGHQPTK